MSEKVRKAIDDKLHITKNDSTLSNVHEIRAVRFRTFANYSTHECTCRGCLL